MHYIFSPVESAKALRMERVMARVRLSLSVASGGKGGGRFGERRVFAPPFAWANIPIHRHSATCPRNWEGGEGNLRLHFAGLRGAKCIENPWLIKSQGNDKARQCREGEMGARSQIRVAYSDQLCLLAKTDSE